MPVACRKETYSSKLVLKDVVSGLPKVGSSPWPSNPDMFRTEVISLCFFIFLGIIDGMKILPTTKLGKRSLLLLVIFFALIASNTVIVRGIFKQEVGAALTDNLFLTALCFAAAAIITGIISVWKYKERSLLIFAYVVFGPLLTISLFGV